MSPAIVSVGDQDATLQRTAVPIHPRARAATVGETHASATTLEIVPLLTVEHAEKFAIVQAVQLPLDTSRAGDEPGMAAQIDQAPPHARFAQEGRGPDEETVERVAAHERAVGEEEGASPDYS
jgi:hypothetical protein